MCVCSVCCAQRIWGEQTAAVDSSARCQKAVRQDGEMEKREGTVTWGLDGKRGGVSRSTELFLSLSSSPSSRTGFSVYH